MLVGRFAAVLSAKEEVGARLIANGRRGCVWFRLGWVLSGAFRFLVTRTDIRVGNGTSAPASVVNGLSRLLNGDGLSRFG